MLQDDDPAPALGVPASAAPPAGTPERALYDLGERLRALTSDSDVELDERVGRLADVESGLLAFIASRVEEDPDFSGEHGQPGLAWAADWRDQVIEKEADGAEADALVERLIQDDASAWREYAEVARDDGRAETCFTALLEATQVDREAISRRLDHEVAAPLHGDRAVLRAAFLDENRAVSPTVPTQSRWATQLADAADVALTAVDDLGPQRAALYLGLVLDDVTWHLENVPVSGAEHRRLQRKQRRLRRERQEQELQGELEGRFGRTAVRRFDKLIVALIFLVLGLLVIHVIYERPEGDARVSDLSPATLTVFVIIDTVACAIFLLEFFVKLALVRDKGSWFLRHFLIDLLPSIPFGLIAMSLGVLDNARAGRALRLLRLFRLTRYARAVGFLARGFDRLGRRYGYLLNHNIVLYPNREERAAAERRVHSLPRQTWRLRSRVNSEWLELLQSAPVDQRPMVAASRTQVLESARDQGLLARPPILEHPPRAAVQDIPAEAMLRSLDAVTPAELEADLGREFVVRSARAIRVFARAPLRWLPVIRKYVPRVAPQMSDGEVTAAAAHQISAELGHHHARWFWVADLHGTVTPSEFVDRVGTAMVRGSFRPAYRLTLFGLGFLIVRGLIEILPWPLLHGLFQTLNTLVGDLLIILGGICFLVLGVGWWLKRLAGQATYFYERTVNAQFLALTEAIKGRYLERDAALLDQRVFAAEDLAMGGQQLKESERCQRFVNSVRSWMIQACASEELDDVSVAMERAVLLYRDALDGALFTESDNRTTSQLLGSPALRQMRALSARVDGRERGQLHVIDLGRARSAIRGPYLWFSFIAKAMSQATARLVVEYNRYAIPLDELAFSGDAERRRYDAWVSTGKPPEGELGRESLELQRRGYITTAFTALHFLDDDPGRDRDVAARFGEHVLANMQRDRRIVFREAFATYPLHARPRDERVLNLYRLYMRWFSGGRAFIIPLRIFWRWCTMFGRFFRWLGRAVGEIRTPRMRGEHITDADADFAAAVRKIGRMRDPVVWACLWMRARFDPEYLGIRIPGAGRSGLEGAGVEADLAFLRAAPHEARRIAAEQARGEFDMRHLAQLVDAGLLDRIAERVGVAPQALTREHMRAAAVAYRADFRSVRALLSCAEILDATAAGALDRPPLARSWLPRFWLKARFKEWYARHGRDDRAARRATWRSIVHDVNGARGALIAWGRLGREAAHERGVAALSDILRHPGRVSEQLVTLRVVQTMSLVDLLNYRTHVYRLGGYEALGAEPQDLLSLGSTSARESYS